MLVEECISRDNADPPATASSPHPALPSSPALPPSPSPQLALPPDLWQDFQALQEATHLDTASLIRRLIHQYGR